MTVLTALEKKETPLACKAYNYLEDLKMYLRAGCEKISFGTETDRLLSTTWAWLKRTDQVPPKSLRLGLQKNLVVIWPSIRPLSFVFLILNN